MKTLTKTTLLAITVNLILFAHAPGADANEPGSASTSQWVQVEGDQIEVVVEQSPADERKRPPFYVNTMLFGGAMREDASNRLTSKQNTDLEGYGYILRTGAVVNDRHLIGLVFQGYLRETRSVLDSQGGDGEIGMIHAYHIGPEYRYQTDFGLYIGGSLGLALNLADNDITGDNDDSPSCDSIGCLNDYLERSDDSLALGVGMMGVLGYEYRPTKWFALNVEAFVTFINAIDENERSMNTVVSGLALGVGI